jgi:hypothetical protein
MCDEGKREKKRKRVMRVFLKNYSFIRTTIIIIIIINK